MADESAAKEAVHTALTAAQVEFAELEQTAVSVCQELEGEGAISGSSVISKLHLRRHERGVDRFLHRGLIRHLLPQL